MRMVSLLRPLVAAFSVVALLVAAPACKKSTPAPTEEGEGAASAENVENAVSVEGVEKAPGAITEDNDFGSITYTVTPEGQVKAVVKTADGKPITKGVTGEFAFKVDDKETKVPATIDEKTGVIVAAGPKLEADLTPISYNLKVQGKYLISGCVTPWRACSPPRARTPGAALTEHPRFRKTPFRSSDFNARARGREAAKRTGLLNERLPFSFPFCVFAALRLCVEFGRPALKIDISVRGARRIISYGERA